MAKESAGAFVALDALVPGAKANKLVGLDAISQGYRAGSVRHEGISNHPKPFAYQFFERSDCLREAARCFAGQVVVDLGAGRRADGYLVCAIAGAKGYVAVEPWNMHALYGQMANVDARKGDRSINELIEGMHGALQGDDDVTRALRQRMELHAQQGIAIPVTLAAEDMLTFLKRIPDHAVSVLACGQDYCMVASDEYAVPVEREIARVLHPQGAYLALGSRLSPQQLEKTEVSSVPGSIRLSKLNKYVRQTAP